MAETSGNDNGVLKKKHGSSGEIDGDRPMKRVRIEDPKSSIPHANPFAPEAVHERNQALHLELLEKNRRIHFLTQKCESLFRRRAISDAAFQCLRRQWFSLLDDFQTIVHALPGNDRQDRNNEEEVWQKIFDELDTFAVPKFQNIKLLLPEWFLSISRGDSEVELPETNEALESTENLLSRLQELDAELEGQMSAKYEQCKSVVAHAFSMLEKALQGNGADREQKSVDLQRIVAEKQMIRDQALRMKDLSLSYKKQLADIERDLEMKEVERHRISRDFDRLTKLIEHTRESQSSANEEEVKEERKDAIEPEKKTEIKEEPEENEHQKLISTLQENMNILSTKLQIERNKTDAMRKELETLKAREEAWRKEEIHVKEDMNNKLELLKEEKNALKEEFNKIRHKAKDMENHLSEKWKKKLTKLQVEVTKAKSQQDELNVKNASLREKLSNYSAYRDQLNEFKSLHETVSRENVHLTKQLKEAKEALSRRDKASMSNEMSVLLKKNEALAEAKMELEESFRHLQDSSTDEGLKSLANRLESLHRDHSALLERHGSSQAELHRLTNELEDLQATIAASKEENDTLVSEIEVMNKELDSARHSKKKALQQLEEKRNSYKKLHTQLSREEQAKAHCFEELAAVRLQVATLTSVHKQQKTVLDVLKEALQAKEKEVEALQVHVKNVEVEKEAAEQEKLKVMRDAEVTKHLYTSTVQEHSILQHQFQQEKKNRTCTKCDKMRVKLEKYENAGANGSSGGSLSDLERFELQDLQKMLKCSVCQDRHKDVIISKCFHMFCKECIDNNLKARNRKCPTCKKMFGQDDVKNVWFT